MSWETRIATSKWEWPWGTKNNSNSRLRTNSILAVIARSKSDAAISKCLILLKMIGKSRLGGKIELNVRFDEGKWRNGLILYIGSLLSAIPFFHPFLIDSGYGPI
jgi:hypothetical protein